MYNFEENFEKVKCSKCDRDGEYGVCMISGCYEGCYIEFLEEQNKQLIDCLKLYYDHCKNNHQINSINETAKKLLEDYNV